MDAGLGAPTMIEISPISRVREAVRISVATSSIMLSPSVSA